LTTASNRWSPTAASRESSSVTSPVSQVTPSGFGRAALSFPRFSTETDIPLSTESRTQDALIVPVPPR
jgi:hypothetical protein